MNYFDISDEEFEELFNTGIEDLDFCVRTYNALKRWGCKTVAELAYMSVEEVQKVRNLRPRAIAFKEVQEKLAERNISLMTQEEKQQILSETDNPKVLRRQIKRLEEREKSSQEKICCYEREKKDEWQEIKKNRKRALKEARGIVHTSPYPIASILRTMYFGQSAKEGCGFCEIFDLWNRHCFVEDDSRDGNDLNDSCEECIEIFLADYYWGQRMSAKLAEERGEVPKMIRMNICGGDLIGRCPVCKQRHRYNKNEYYCFRCGSFLNWDEENWDEKTRENVYSCFYDDDDEFNEEEVSDGDVE